MKCKFCTDETDFVWKEVKGKWKLSNENTGKLHECKRNKVSEISSDTPRKYDRTKRLNNDKGTVQHGVDWKPEFDYPSVRLCGICNTYLTKNIDFKCQDCNQFLLKICDHFCKKCGKHPSIVHVKNDPDYKPKYIHDY